MSPAYLDSTMVFLEFWKKVEGIIDEELETSADDNLDDDDDYRNCVI